MLVLVQILTLMLSKITTTVNISNSGAWYQIMTLTRSICVVVNDILVYSVVSTLHTSVTKFKHGMVLFSIFWLK
jgi:hypothetical protein